MISKYEVDEYIQEQINQGQTVEAMVEHILYDRVDIDTYIITKEYGLPCHTTNAKKKKCIKEYVEYVQRHG